MNPENQLNNNDPKGLSLANSLTNSTVEIKTELPAPFNPNFPTIAVIDTNKPHKESDIPSHYDLVTEEIKKVHDINLIGRDVGVPDDPSQIDFHKLVFELSDLATKVTPLNLKAVNLSVGKNLSYQELNQIVQRSEDPKAGYQIITPENISETENTKRIIQALTTSQNQDYINFSKAVRLLTDQNVAVIISAGNNGENLVNLLCVISPEAIVVGSINGTQKSIINSSTPLIDGYASGWVDVNNNYAEGTSFSTPKIAIQAAKLANCGYTPREIEQIVRIRTTPNDPQYSRQVALVDLAENIEILKGPFNDERFETLKALLGVNDPAFKVASMTNAVNSLSQGEISFWLAISDKASFVGLDMDTFKEVTNIFRSMTSEQQDCLTKKLDSVGNRSQQLGDIYALLK